MVQMNKMAKFEEFDQQRDMEAFMSKLIEHNFLPEISSEDRSRYDSLSSFMGGAGEVLLRSLLGR